MEEEATKLCANCKRDIPAVNFTIHLVHCERNIKVCPVCKEPVLLAELGEHHEKLHKLLPCKQCGESVCGTDLEDHIRDSCGHTVKACRFCTLEVARRELPAHESYCGARTERCPDCEEFIMLKYKHIHLDSNHGFLRLPDDPAPIKNAPKPSPRQTTSAFANLDLRREYPALPKVVNQDRPQTSIRYFNGDSGTSPTTSALPSASVIKNEFPSNGAAPLRTKRDNHQPQINTAVQPVHKITKDLQVSRGAVKKRPAPKPPREPPTLDPRRESAYQSALQRAQEEERRRQEQTERNLAAGLPPVLSPAAKLEKLRKMDALHNRETENVDYKDKLQGRVWMPPDVPIGQRLGSDPNHRSYNSPPERRRISRDSDRHVENHTGSDDQNAARIIQNVQNDARTELNCQDGAGSCQNGGSSCQNAAKNCQCRVKNCIDHVRNCLRNINEESDQISSDIRRVKKAMDKNDLRDVIPMSAEQFLTRFSELAVGEDRFQDIKSQLTQLRRGLNQVTAPFTSNSTNNPRSRRRSLTPEDEDQLEEGEVEVEEAEDSDVRLPCEFCDVLVPADELVQHQTGCRPDLARLSPSAGVPLRRSPCPSPAAPSSPPPLIPCEFCTQPMPVYLISEHQERCGRESNQLYAD